VHRRASAPIFSSVSRIILVVFLVMGPLEALGHFLHDHVDQGIDRVVPHEDELRGSNPQDHDEHHTHVWVMPVSAVLAPEVDRPNVIELLSLFEPLSRPPAPIFPPFSPPRG
jgi:hypothetical protein